MLNKSRLQASLPKSALLLALLASAPAFGKDLLSSESARQIGAGSPHSAPPSDVEQVNVDSIKEKYWARGNATELGVVQNRAYSKKGKLEFSVMGGILYSDPFLSVTPVGGSIGYHFSEYLSLHALGFKHFVTPSSALQTFQSESSGGTVNANIPRYYVGLEGMGSLFYGKLSVLGQAIIYYDFYLTLGGGATNTESGTYATPTIGLGQRFYSSRHISIRLDYRMAYYREDILEKVIPTKLGQIAGARDNFNNVIVLGISLMPFGK